MMDSYDLAVLRFQTILDLVMQKTEQIARLRREGAPTSREEAELDDLRNELEMAGKAVSAHIPEVEITRG